MTAELVEREPVPPAFEYRPECAYTLLPQVERMCTNVLGERLEAEQRRAIDVLTGRNADGTPASLVAAVICARQNLKTFILERIILTILLQPKNGVQLIVWTSQRLVTCDKTFDKFCDWFEGKDRFGRYKYPALAKRLVKINRGKGEKAVIVRVGDEVRTIQFLARSPKSGQGLTGDIVVFDEGFAVEAEHVGAVGPILSTRRRAMVFWGSSACHADSDELRKIVELGRAGAEGELVEDAPAFVEWCAPGSWKDPGCKLKDCRHEPIYSDGCALDDRNLVQQANPLAGIIRLDGEGITWKFLRQERTQMLAPPQYARERLGWHEEPDKQVEAPITVEMWKRCDDEPDPETGYPGSQLPEGAPVVLSPEIANDRSSASISIAGIRADGKRHLELIEHEFGVDWLLPRMRELARRWNVYEVDRGLGPKPKRCKAVVIDPSSNARDLIDPLRRDWVDEDGQRVKGFEPVVMTAGEAATSAGMLEDGLQLETVAHRVSPTVEAAIKGAIRRDVGDGGWTWGRKRSAKEHIDITPAASVTNAHWGLAIVEEAYDLLDSVHSAEPLTRDEIRDADSDADARAERAKSLRSERG